MFMPAECRFKDESTISTLRYARGKLAEGFKENVIIETPLTTSKRGNHFTMTVDELGPTIILLPVFPKLL